LIVFANFIQSGQPQSPIGSQMLQRLVEFIYDQENPQDECEEVWESAILKFIMANYRNLEIKDESEVNSFLLNTPPSMVLKLSYFFIKNTSLNEEYSAMNMLNKLVDLKSDCINDVRSDQPIMNAIFESLLRTESDTYYNPRYQVLVYKAGADILFKAFETGQDIMSHFNHYEPESIETVMMRTIAIRKASQLI